MEELLYVVKLFLLIRADEIRVVIMLESQVVEDLTMVTKLGRLPIQ